jgi:hypothetical protein
MRACFTRHRSVLAFALVALASASAACTIRTEPVGGAAGDPNEQVAEVVVVGTNVTSGIHVTGELGVTTLPKDANKLAVLGKGLKVSMHISSPTPMDVDVLDTECTEPDASAKGISIGVILDDSGSMGSSDPKRMRKDATVSFLNTLGADDRVLLTDYGKSGNDLRDLLCVSEGGAKCTPPEAKFSSDKAALIKATELIANGGGTPLYESCVQMTPLVDTQKGVRRGMLLLSDGRPNSESKRQACHDAAKAAQIPVFTVGLGPAAEGDARVDPRAVKVLRELSTETGGSYASANDPAQLDGLFQNMGAALAKGSCRTSAKVRGFDKLEPGSKVTGEITIGNKGARSTFEFVTPER